MQSGPSPAPEARLRHRHGVRTLTYVTLDQGNGGILLNLTRNGVAVQSVAAVRMGQQVQVRFDLLAPRVRVNARGEVVWATSSGRCGVRFLDLPLQTARELDEWTFSKLLEGASPLPLPTRPIFPASQLRNEPQPSTPGNVPVAKSANLAEDEEPIEQSAAGAAGSTHDNLIISPGHVQVIDLPPRSAPEPISNTQIRADASVIPDLLPEPASQLDWLSQPLSGKGLAWTINTLVVLAAWLLSVLVFLSVLREIPKWPFSMVLGAAIVVAALYWGFFRIFAGASLGTKLVQLMQPHPDQDEPEEDRFR
ncbi:MAG TPA: PilZ domain-containing protein [Candidatus Sulfotelmatobacter sp.]|nr:PilZ domain-containing protein [Candidatus Sulfotelmatobacter sp.]